MALGITVPYTIAVDSGANTTGIREGAPQTGPWAEVKFHCHWDDRYQLCIDLLGTAITTPNPAGGFFIFRQPPFRYPAAPSLFCTDITDISPLGKPIIPRYLGLPWMARQIAVVTARFEIPGYSLDGSDQSGQPFTVLSFASAGEFMTIPDTTYLFADGTPTTYPVGFFVPQIEFTWTRHRMPLIPDTVIANMSGKVNSDQFAISRTFLANPGTVMFMTGTGQVEGNPTAMFLTEFGYLLNYTVEYKFMFRFVPWNYIFKPDRVTGFAPVTDGSGNPPYPTVPFTGAFP